MEPEDAHPCALCNKMAKKRCSGCQNVYYCSPEHQKTHWKADHSKNCRAYKLVNNAQLGRHYVATRNIEVGETVIYDKVPLLTTPSLPTIPVEENGISSVELDTHPVCLSCYVELTADKAKPCDKCGWPLCQKCTEHGSECEFTIKHHGAKVNIAPEEYGQRHPAYAIIGITRALALRENDPKSYRKLMNHEDLSTLATVMYLEYSFRKAAKYAKMFFKLNDVEETEIRRIMRILWINSDITVSPDVPSRCNISDASSYVEHNCRANCAKSRTENGGLIVWAVVPISKGDHISACYDGALMRTIPRRNNLVLSHFFECQCERCKDPTEFGTMFSALKCRTEGCDGCMLPPTFLVTDRNYPDYVCSKCSATEPWILMQANDAKIYTDWMGINKFDISECENFIAKWKNSLPENHAYIVDIEIELARNIFFNGGDITKRSDECLIDLVKLCKKLTKLIKTLAPAENRLRGVLLFIQYGVNKELIIRNESKTTSEAKECDSIMECGKMLEEINQLLHREPTFFPLENKIAKEVLEIINETWTPLKKALQGRSFDRSG